MEAWRVGRGGRPQAAVTSELRKEALSMNGELLKRPVPVTAKILWTRKRTGQVTGPWECRGDGE